MTPRSQKFAFSFATVALLGLALYFAYATMFHYWAAGFHDAHFGFHEAWGNRFSVLALVFLGLATWACTATVRIFLRKAKTQ